MIVKLHLQRLTGYSSAPARQAATAAMAEQVAQHVQRHGLDATTFARIDRITNLCDRIAFDFCFEAPATGEVPVFPRYDADAEVKVSTIQRRLASISQAHQLAGHASPTASPEVRAVMKGIRRELGTAQAGKQPAVTEVIRAMVEHLPDTLLGRRDRALLLVGFPSAFRRSELVALTVADVRFAHEGLIVTLRRSKTDSAARQLR